MLLPWGVGPQICLSGVEALTLGMVARHPRRWHVHDQQQTRVGSRYSAKLLPGMLNCTDAHKAPGFGGRDERCFRGMAAAAEGHECN